MTSHFLETATDSIDSQCENEEYFDEKMKLADKYLSLLREFGQLFGCDAFETTDVYDFARFIFKLEEPETTNSNSKSDD